MRRPPIRLQHMAIVNVDDLMSHEEAMKTAVKEACKGTIEERSECIESNKK